MSKPASRTVSQTSVKNTELVNKLNLNFKGIIPHFQKLTDLSKLDKEDVNKIFMAIDTIVTDCDGVLWVDDEPIPGSIQVINKFKEIGKKVIFLTNNSTKHRDYFVIKSKIIGFDIEKQEIVSTASLVASYLKSKGFNKKVYIIGSIGLAKEIEDVGIKHLEIGPDVVQKNLFQTIETFHADPEVGAVVVGFDEHFSFLKLLKAASYLNKPSCIFLATNYDKNMSINSEIVLPGTGAIVKSVETVSQKEPFLVGKPSDYIVEALVHQYGIHPMGTLIIGDCCKTDILLGTRSGFQTLLVLSGLTKLEEVEALKDSSDGDERDLVPDYYIAKLGDLLTILN